MQRDALGHITVAGRDFCHHPGQQRGPGGALLDGFHRVEDRVIPRPLELIRPVEPVDHLAAGDRIGGVGLVHLADGDGVGEFATAGLDRVRTGDGYLELENLVAGLRRKFPATWPDLPPRGPS